MLRAHWFLVPLTTAILSPRVAIAQSREDVARADALFSAGKALTDAGQFQDACAKFAESKRLAPGIGVTLYLADCYEHVGRTASAWTEFRSAEGQARERSDKRADVARAHAQSLEAKLNRLAITVAPTVPLSGLQVLRDGLPVEREELGVATPVDPGDHTVVVSAPGHAARILSAHVGPETPSVNITIDALGVSSAPEPGPPPAAQAPSSPTPAAGLAERPAPPPSTGAPGAVSPGAGWARPDDPGKTRRWLGLSVAGAGVVGVGLGAAFGVIAKARLDQSNSSHCDATDHCDATGLGLRKDSESAATVSTIAFAAGGAVLAAGLVLYVTAPRGAASSAITIAPAPIAHGGGGAILRVTF